MQYGVTVTGASSWTVVGHSSLVVGRTEGSKPTTELILPTTNGGKAFQEEETVTFSF